MHLKELDANLVVVLDALLIDASVTKAAERLGRSPSAISHALANLREVFGDELFVRAGQRLAPTAKALEIAPTIHVIVSGLESLLRPSAPFDPATQERGFVFLCSETAEFTLLQPLHDLLKARAPGVQAARSGLEPDGWMEKLRQGGAQFAIVEALEPGETGELHWRELFAESWITLAPTGCADARDGRGARHIVAMAPPGLQDRLRQNLADRGVDLASVAWASSPFAGLLLSLKANGPVTLPASVAKAAEGLLPLQEVGSDGRRFQSRTFLVWHRSNDRDECHAWLRDRIADCAPRLS